MSNLFYSMMVFSVSLEVTAFIFWAFGVLPAMGISYPFGNYQSITNLSDLFALNLWSALFAGAGALIGIAALLLRQGTYALYAMLLFAIGVMVKPIQWVLLAIPNTLVAILPLSTNPTPGSPNPLEIAVGILVVFAAFIFFLEMVIQRKVS